MICTSERMVPMRDSHSPSPAQYNTSEDLTKVCIIPPCHFLNCTSNMYLQQLQKSGVTSGFKSGTKRFVDHSKPEDAGPGCYVPKSTIVHPVPVFPRPSRSGIVPMRPPSPPSIPARVQSHGYEVLPTGEVKPQPPAIPGYSGLKNDTVGPGDYNPRIDVKFKAAPKAVFPKDPERTELDKVLAKRSDAPGPGYYNTHSSFDLTGGHSPMESDFLIHLNAAKKRQLSVFESKTARSSLEKEIERRKALPGPGEYSLPSTIKVESKPSSLQFFASSGPRFKEVRDSTMLSPSIAL